MWVIAGGRGLFGEFDVDSEVYRTLDEAREALAAIRAEGGVRPDHEGDWSIYELTEVFEVDVAVERAEAEAKVSEHLWNDPGWH